MGTMPGRRTPKEKEPNFHPHEAAALSALEQLGLPRKGGRIILCLIKVGHDLKVNDIAKETGIDRTEVSAYVRGKEAPRGPGRLFALGFIRRRVEPHGDRSGRDRVFIGLAMPPSKMPEHLGVEKMTQLEGLRDAVPNVVVEAEAALEAMGHKGPPTPG